MSLKVADKQKIRVRHYLNGNPEGETEITRNIYEKDGEHVVRFGDLWKKVTYRGFQPYIDSWVSEVKTTPLSEVLGAMSNSIEKGRD